MTYFAIPAKNTLFALAACLSFSAVRGDWSNDPVLGSWRLNDAKCRFSSPVPSVSIMRNYQPAGGGLTRISETRLLPDEQRILVEYVARYDSKEYAIFVTPAGTGAPTKSDDTVSFRRVDRYTVEGVFRRHGSETSEFTREVSKDRQTLYVRITGIDSSGHQILTVLVYDRLVT
jgi:hypothetical protein